jgi:hypothetical protein
VIAVHVCRFDPLTCSLLLGKLVWPAMSRLTVGSSVYRDNEISQHVTQSYTFRKLGQSGNNTNMMGLPWRFLDVNRRPVPPTDRSTHHLTRLNFGATDALLSDLQNKGSPTSESWDMEEEEPLADVEERERRNFLRVDSSQSSKSDDAAVDRNRSPSPVRHTFWLCLAPSYAFLSAPKH